MNNWQDDFTYELNKHNTEKKYAHKSSLGFGVLFSVLGAILTWWVLCFDMGSSLAHLYPYLVVACILCDSFAVAGFMGALLTAKDDLPDYQSGGNDE